MSWLDSLFADIGALHDTGLGGNDVGKGNSSFSAAEVGRMTGSSSREAARAGHDARDAMAKEGGWGIPADRGNGKK